MPELPEVETVRRGLAPVLVGQHITRLTLRRADLRRPFPPRFAERVKGRRVENLDRRGKYLVARLEGDLCLVMHLGMSGSFRVTEAGARSGPEPDRTHDHVVLTLQSGGRIRFNDPRRFGAMDLVDCDRPETEPPLAGLGVEPLGADLTVAFLREAFEGRSSPIKAALLDQRIIAGLGNIYVCEALWSARISPLRLTGSLVDGRGRATAGLTRLPDAIREVLRAAIDSGGSSLRNHFRTDGSLGTFQHAFNVYDREGEPCRRATCGGTVRRIVQSGRSTFYCPRCQH